MTKSKFNTKQLVLAALCVALGVVLPVAFHSIPNAGSVLLPMHIPVLLCGLVCGPVYGLLSGILTPLLSSMITGMPPMAYLPGMLCELAAYGLVSGVFWHKVKHTVPMMYASLVTAMVAGRLVWGAVRFVLAGLAGSSFPFSAFLSGAVLTAVPGIVAQLILIPLIVAALQKAKLTD